MSDIVERLRELAEEWHECCGDIHAPLTEAAAEIERLRWLLREVFGESRLTDQLNWPGDLRERVREALGEVR